MADYAGNKCELEALEQRLFLSGTHYVVDSLADTVADDGFITLREAIQAANANDAIFDAPAGSSEETDIITFSSDLGDEMTIGLTGGRMQITDNLSIQGPGRGKLTIDVISSPYPILGGIFDVYGDDSYSNYVSVEISSMTLTNGSNYGGSAIRAVDHVNLSVSDIHFLKNKSRYDGGAIYFVGDSQSEALTVTSCMFNGNTSRNGGAIYSTQSVNIYNTVICGNYASGEGSAVYLEANSNVTVKNSTICGNPANIESEQDAIVSESVEFHNSIVVMNDETTYCGDAGDTNFMGYYEHWSQSAYCDMYGRLYADGIFVRNPSAGADETWGTDDDDYGDLHLRDNCPLINSGDIEDAVDPSGNTLALDAAGNPRVIGQSVDLGAYESDGSPAQTYIVESFDAIIAEDGVLTFIEALTASNTNTACGDAPAGSGVYQDTITFAAGLSEYQIPAETDIRITDDLAITGPGREFLSIIGADGEYSVYVDNYVNVTLSGLDIAGEIYNEGRLTVTDCAIHDGGISSFHQLTVNNSDIYDNETGIYSRGKLTVTNSSICNNSEYGLHVRSYNEMLIFNTVIGGNGADAIRLPFTTYHPTQPHTLYLLNNTIADNSGGIGYIYENAEGVIANNIIARNTTEQGYDLPEYTYALLVSNNIIGSWKTYDTGMNFSGSTEDRLNPKISELSLLKNGRWGYYLYESSLAIDNGDTDIAMEYAGQYISTDMTGNPRISGQNIDIGATEGTADLPGVAPQLYVVNSLADTVAADGFLTLREAIEAANTNTAVGDAPAGSDKAMDIITFASGLSGTILLGGSELEITDSVNIIGPGSDVITIDAQKLSRVINIPEIISVKISGLTISGGKLIDPQESGYYSIPTCGAGILNTGNLQLEGVTVSDNMLSGYECKGAGIANIDGWMVINNSVIEHNINAPATYSSGGGIYTDEKLLITNTIFRYNAADYGGGIYYRSGLMEITGATITENYAIEGGGGGIFINASNRSSVFKTDTVKLYDVELTKNAAIEFTTLIFGPSIGTQYVPDGKGGAIYIALDIIEPHDDNRNYTLNIDMQNVSICGNQAVYGGGLYVDAYFEQWVPEEIFTSSVSIANSIFSANIASDSGGAVYADSGCLDLTNVTIAGNQAAEEGGGLFILSEQLYSLNVGNCIIAHNSNGNSATGYYSIGWSNNNYSSSRNEIFVRNPSAGSDGIWGTNDDDYGDLHLIPNEYIFGTGSRAKAVDAFGNPLEFDMDGNPRVVFGTPIECEWGSHPWQHLELGEVDLGAYEYQGFESDVNYDGAVNMLDFLQLRSNYGQATTGGRADGDIDANGIVNIFDFLLLRSQYGLSEELPEPYSPYAVSSAVAATASEAQSQPPSMDDYGEVKIITTKADSLMTAPQLPASNATIFEKVKLPVYEFDFSWIV